MTTEIADREALHSLPSYPGRRRTAPIVLTAPEADAAMRSKVEQRLNRHYYACGCEAGAAAVAIVLLAAVTAGGVRLVAGAGLTAQHFGWALGCLLGAGLLGKLFGLAWSWVAYRRARHDASNFFPTPWVNTEPEQRRVPTCQTRPAD